MKFSEIKEKSISDLLKVKNQLADEFILMKMKNSLGQLSNPIKIREIRRRIAQVNTLLVSKK